MYSTGSRLFPAASLGRTSIFTAEIVLSEMFLNLNMVLQLLEVVNFML